MYSSPATPTGSGCRARPARRPACCDRAADGDQPARPGSMRPGRRPDGGLGGPVEVPERPAARQQRSASSRGAGPRPPQQLSSSTRGRQSPSTSSATWRASPGGSCAPRGSERRASRTGSGRRARDRRCTSALHGAAAGRARPGDVERERGDGARSTSAAVMPGSRTSTAAGCTSARARNPTPLGLPVEPEV